MATHSSAVLKIHNAAVRLFTERGARDVSVSDLAQAAGVARGTIYNNIDDPAALFDQVAANLLHDMHLRVSGSMQEVSDPASRIAIGIRLFVRHTHEEPSWARFLVQFGSSDDVMRRMLDEPPTVDLTRGMREGRFNVSAALLPAALSLVGGTTLAAMQGVLSGRQTWRDAGEQVAELVLKALGLPPDEAHAIAIAELPALAPAQPRASNFTANFTPRPEVSMSIIKIEDIAYVRFTAPDLPEMTKFLHEFGLTPLLADDGVLYARGAGPAPFLHATVQGEPGFAGLGLRAGSVADLELLAREEGRAVEPLNTPGGGSVVRLIDPDGNLVEVVAGQAQVPTLMVAADHPRNTALAKTRLRQSVRLSAGASTIIRLGHAVLSVKDFRASEAWYKSRFGFITSDEIEVAPEFAIGAFMRCDRGDSLTDHHTLFLLQGPDGPGFMHAAFEVANFDDLMRGHAHLKAAQRKAAWGVGRHILGSQIFDYWLDPWGHELEHWTDGDLFTAADGSNTATLQDLLGVQWGAEHPMMVAAATQEKTA